MFIEQRKVCSIWQYAECPSCAYHRAEYVPFVVTNDWPEQLFIQRCWDPGFWLWVSLLIELPDHHMHFRKNWDCQLPARRQCLGCTWRLSLAILRQLALVNATVTATVTVRTEGKLWIPSLCKPPCGLPIPLEEKEYDVFQSPIHCPSLACPVHQVPHCELHKTVLSTVLSFDTKLHDSSQHSP